MSCIVVLGFLNVFVIIAVRLPPENLLEAFSTASPLAIVIVALFEASRGRVKVKEVTRADILGSVCRCCIKAKSALMLATWALSQKV